MSKTKPTHGGKRKGAGRKKSAPNAVYSVTMNKALKDRLIAKYGGKELARMTKAYHESIDKNEIF